MPKSEATALIERIERTLYTHARYVDCAVRLVVYETGPDGSPVPSERDPYVTHRSRVYGGRYDKLLKEYVLDDHGKRVVPERVQEVTCTVAQFRFCTIKKRGLKRVIGIGAMGAGKSEAGAIRALLEALERPNTCGGVLAPTGPQLTKIRDEKLLPLLNRLGFVEDYQTVKKRCVLVNGTIIEFSAAQKQAREKGYPFQGADWDWAVADEASSMDDGAYREIMARGRTRARTFAAYFCTTYDEYPHFVMWLERLRMKPAENQVIKFYCDHNAFIDREQHLETLKEMPRHEYERKVLLRDVQPERLVYPRFRLAYHVRPRPPEKYDVTHEVVGKSGFGGFFDALNPCRFILAQDFGELVHATIVLRAYKLPLGADPSLPANQVVWFAEHEITSVNTGADFHARTIKEWLSRSQIELQQCLVVADPHDNLKGDRSNYNVFIREGMQTVKASQDKIPVAGRLLMVNALMENSRIERRTRCTISCATDCIGHGETRLYLEGEGGRANCERLARAFMSFQRRADGQPQPERKDLVSDHTHWPDALGYGLYPFEKLLAEMPTGSGGGGIVDMSSPFTQKLLKRSQERRRY